MDRGWGQSDEDDAVSSASSASSASSPGRMPSPWGVRRGATLGELFGDLSGWKTSPPRPPLARQGTPPDATAPDGDGAGSAPLANDPLRPLGSSADDLEKMLTEPLWRLQDAHLPDALALVGRVRSALARIEVAVVAEAMERGLPGSEGHSPVDWTTAAEGSAAPKPDPRHVSQVVDVARSCRVASPGDGAAGSALGAPPDREMPGAEVFAEAFTGGALSLDRAGMIARFARDVAAVGDPEAIAADVESLVGVASHGEEGRGVPIRELARAIRFATRLIRPAKDLERDEARQRLGRGLVKSSGPAGMSTYRLTLDPEGAAVIDSAVADLSAPVPGPDGELDPRSAATRRADALLTLVGRAVAAGQVEEGLAPGERAQVVVTIPLAHLEDGLRGAGLTLSGELLSPAVVRRMACDARIIPMVLGADGQLLDLGRSRRLFSPAQRLAAWRRDGHCSFPGCSIPATWTEVHHEHWWSRGGPTDLSNAALLCQRHHSLVHTRDLRATIDATGVTWHV